MKHIKLLFSISLLFTSSSFSCAQAIIDSTNYFYLTYNTSNGKYKGSVAQVKKSTLVTNEYYFNADTLIVSNNQVFFKKNNVNKLYFDFKLQLKDTFYFKNTTGIDTMEVDSIKSVTLDDGKPYKHMFLKSQYQFNPIIWVEGLGEKNLGWIRYDLKFTEMPELKAICKNTNLIYWYNSFDGLETINIADSCDFNYLNRQLFIPNMSHLKIGVYPNPANNTLNIVGINSGHYTIYNSFGTLMSEGLCNNSINIEALPKGCFHLLIKFNNEMYNGKFIKE
jgi:hypothetical protein